MKVSRVADGRSAEYPVHIARLQRIGSQAIDIVLPDGGLDFAPGKFTVLIGSNASGKTTLLEALLGIRPDYRVQAKILGFDAISFPVERKKSIGVSLQSYDFTDSVSIADILRLHARAFRMPVNREMASSLGLDEIADKQFAKISGGQKKRVSLYFALAHAPEVGFMDEPEAGLDHQGLEVFLGLIEARTQAGKTSIAASHNAMVLGAADGVLYLDHGKVQYQGSKTEFIATRLGDSVLEIDTGGLPRDALMSMAESSVAWCFDGGQDEKLILFGPNGKIAGIRTDLPDDIGQKTIFRESRASDILTWINRRASA